MTEEKKLPIGEIISSAWRIVTKNFWFFAGLMIIYLAVSGIPSAIQSNTDSEAVINFMGVINLVLGILFSIGIIKISLLATDDKPFDFSHLYKSYRKFFMLLIGQLLYGLIVLGGFILLIVPGIIWGIKYSLYPYYIIDKDMGPVSAISASGKATSGHKWQLFLFNLVLGLVNLAGMLALLVGIFWTIPTTWLAQAKAYRWLDSEAK